jgi:hypothetical protein
VQTQADTLGLNSDHDLVVLFESIKPLWHFQVDIFMTKIQCARWFLLCVRRDWQDNCQCASADGIYSLTSLTGLLFILQQWPYISNSLKDVHTHLAYKSRCSLHLHAWHVSIALHQSINKKKSFFFHTRMTNECELSRS